MLDIAHQAFGFGKGIVAERQDDAARSGFQLVDIGAAAQGLDPHQREQLLDLVGQGPETVDHFGGKTFDFRMVEHGRQTLVQAQPQGQIADIMFGDHHRRADGDGGRPLRLGNVLVIAHTGLERSDRFFQHFLVQLVADFLDMARLLVAQEIARAAQIEVMRSQHETGPQTIERLQHFEPFFGLIGHRLAGRHGKQRISTDFAASDTAA